MFSFSSSNPLRWYRVLNGLFIFSQRSQIMHFILSLGLVFFLQNFPQKTFHVFGTCTSGWKVISVVQKNRFVLLSVSLIRCPSIQFDQVDLRRQTAWSSQVISCCKLRAIMSSCLRFLLGHRLRAQHSVKAWLHFVPRKSLTALWCHYKTNILII